MQSAIQEISRNRLICFNAAGTQVRSIIKDPVFWLRLQLLVTLLLPFTKVVMGIQSRRANLADIFRYFIFLGTELLRMTDHLPMAFAEHCIKMYNFRYRSIVQPICHLALFLHPQFKHVFTLAGSYTANVCKPACQLLQKIRHGSVANMQALVSELALYRDSSAPYDLPFVAGMSLSAWWHQVHGAASPYLVKIAILLADICPHAADVERLFSIMGNFHTPRRGNLSASGLEMMSKLKIFYACAPPRIKKAAADIDPDKVPSLPLPEDRPEMLFQADGDAEASPDEDVQNALNAFCADGLQEMADAEMQAMGEATQQGKCQAEVEALKFSGRSLEISAVYPIFDASCIAAFAPESELAAAPAAQVEQPYEGPLVDVDQFLNQSMFADDLGM